MHHVVWLLVFIFNFACVFRFSPTSIFIVTPSPNRFPTKAEDPYTAMRRLFISPRRQAGNFKTTEVYYYYLLLLLLSLLLLLLLLLSFLFYYTFWLSLTRQLKSTQFLKCLALFVGYSLLLR